MYANLMSCENKKIYISSSICKEFNEKNGLHYSWTCAYLLKNTFKNLVFNNGWSVAPDGKV